MAQAGRTFRIFVSSTFGDLKEERNALQKHVFPKLRELCLQHGCRFQAIDLRWGVSEEAGLDQQTMKICLEEIARCQRVTPRPNFIVLLGDRYGWCPLPYEIPDSEFQEILTHIADREDTKLLERWYWRDDNADPPVYDLQPRIGEYVKRANWQPIERRLHLILNEAVRSMSLSEEDQSKYWASATEQEINHGALKTEDALNHAFCFFRSILVRQEDGSFCPINKSLLNQNFRDFVDLDPEGNLDQKAHTRLKKLKRVLGNMLNKNIHEYKVNWTGKGVTTDHIGSLPDDLDACMALINDEASPSTLCVDVWKNLASVILHEIKQLETIDDLDAEIAEHENFGLKLRGVSGKNLQGCFVGQADILHQISEYIKTTNSRLMVIYGESGTGKSTVIAEAAELSRREQPNAVIVQRFIGATPSSSDGRSLLESLCLELSRIYGAREARLSPKYEDLIQEFPKRLSLSGLERPLILFIDALDQLADEDNSLNLAWLQNKLPDHVRLIVSVVNEKSTDTSIQNSYFESFSMLEKQFSEFSIVELKPMLLSDGSKLLELWLRNAKRTLQEHQKNEILEKFDKNGLPLYLKLAFEEAKLLKSYSRSFEINPTIQGIISDFLKRLSANDNHGEILVFRSLSYLSSSKNGLSEDEMMDLLSMDEDIFNDFTKRSKHNPPDKIIPAVIWSRLYFDLEPYLTERSADGTNLLTFYHRQLVDVVAKEVFIGNTKKLRHRTLAKFFLEQPLWIKGQGQKLPNLRKASELPYHQVHGELWDQLESTLSDINFLEQKVAIGNIFNLLEDFNTALIKLPRTRPYYRIIKLIQGALRREIHFIIRHPSTLFQTLWNSCWWYDCSHVSQNSSKYRTKNLSDHTPLALPQIKFSTILDSWRREKELKTPGFVWMRSLRPPARDLDDGQVACFKGHTYSVYSVAFSSNSHFVVSGSEDWTACVWETVSGHKKACLKGHQGEKTTAWGFPVRHGGDVRSVAVSPDNRLIATGSDDTTICIWDSQNFKRIARLKWHKEEVYCVAFSPNGNLIASGAKDKTICLWDINSGRLMGCLRGHEEGVAYGAGLCGTIYSINFSPDGSKLISGAVDKTIRLWDVKSQKEIASYRCDDQIAYCVAFSPNGKLIVSGSSDRTIRVWDIEEGKESFCLKLAKSEKTAIGSIVFSVSFSPDGKKIVSGSSDGSVRLWDVETQKEIAGYWGHKGEVYSVAFSSDGNLIASASKDMTVRLWDVHMAPTQSNGPDKGKIDSIIFSSKGRLIATSLPHLTWRIWSINNVLPVFDFPASHKNQWDFSPDESKLAFSGNEYTFIILDKNSGEELRRYNSLSDFSKSRDSTPNESKQIIYKRKPTISILDTYSWEVNGRFYGHSDYINCVVFSPDGFRIASGSRDKTIRIWDVDTGNELLCLKGHDDEVKIITFSPDGQKIASIAKDYNIKIWDSKSGIMSGLIRAPKYSEMKKLLFSFDGNELFYGFVTRAWPHTHYEAIIYDLESGKSQKKFNWSGFSGVKKFSSREFDYSRSMLDIIIEHKKSRKPVAWLPANLDELWNQPSFGRGSTHADFLTSGPFLVSDHFGRVWAGSSNGAFVLFSLEGVI